MAPSTFLRLSTPFLPHALPLNLKSPIFPFPHSTPRRSKPRNPPLISCRATDPSPSPPLSVDSPGTGTGTGTGTGAAAPTPGELFLERRRAADAATTVLKAAKKERRKEKEKKKKQPKKKISTAVACCYGCGAPLQIEEVDAPGYVDVETYELKKKHRQLRTILCGRCKLLAHGHMVPAVGGHGGYPGGKQFVTAEQLREKLSHLKDEKALIVKLVDIVDFNGSFLARVRDLAGKNPIILVITKIDLLPKETDLNCIGDWVVEASARKKLNVISVHLTSSKSLVGIAGVTAEIQKEKKGRDVYILGAANVGKSAFINSMLKMMAEKDPIAAAARKYKPIQSAVPGTTLGPIPIHAFPGGKLFDTPGVHLHHRQSAVVHSEDLQFLAPRSRLKGHPFMASSDNAMNEQRNDLNGLSVFWGGLVRIDIQKVLPQTRLTFYGPRAVQIHSAPISEADEFYQKEVGQALTPPTGKEKAEIWAGLQAVRQLTIPFDNIRRPACDIVISGLGWIAVEPASRFVKTSCTNELDDNYSGELEFGIHVPKAVEVFVRPPLPVGVAGAQWYEYRELTEKEEELRPKWFF